MLILSFGTRDGWWTIFDGTYQSYSPVISVDIYFHAGARVENCQFESLVLLTTVTWMKMSTHLWDCSESFCRSQYSTMLNHPSNGGQEVWQLMSADLVFICEAVFATLSHRFITLLVYKLYMLFFPPLPSPLCCPRFSSLWNLVHLSSRMLRQSNAL